MKFVIYPAKDGYRWRLVARNGRIMADSAEAYTRQFTAIEAVNRMRAGLWNRGVRVVKGKR
jgi:uncharacterized protein YegP (UPF0339 family)